MLSLICISVFAQKADTTKFSARPKAKAISRIPVIKGSVQSYKPSYNIYSTSDTHTKPAAKEKNERTLTVLKIYPNPVVEQININLRLEKETSLSIKITDLLGNEVVTLANERIQLGEHTKTYSVPAKLNAGIYFLRIVAGGEPVIRKISVL
ncbi:T9SS type A sorting domain-containing protein [Pedobacter xixiisoli]|nr:T9SS type A sorting domain-containing protein [Pedobacter xixiisoli]